MRTRAPSWHQQVTCCASSLGNRCWECRFSKLSSVGIMSQTIWLGAVAYNPKVVTIWEGMRRYFHEEAHLPIEVVLFQSYEAQVFALLAKPGESAPRIHIAWNTN